MGGPGSGRYNGAKKRRVESCLALDVNELRREGALTPGASGTLSWERDDGAPSLAFRAEVDALVVAYLAEHVAASEVAEQRIALTYGPATFGGTRVYFVCPGSECGRRVSKLYLARGAVRCRDCHGLAYECQAEDRQRRAGRRADKRRVRLGSQRWSAGALPVLARPKGMWRSTFAGLQERAVAADIVADMHLDARLMKIARGVHRRRRRKLNSDQTA
jgi:hypothetical protein